MKHAKSHYYRARQHAALRRLYAPAAEELPEEARELPEEAAQDAPESPEEGASDAPQA